MADNLICTGDCNTCVACRAVKDFGGEAPHKCPGEDTAVAKAGVAQCHKAGCPTPGDCGDHCSAEAELDGLKV